MFVNWGIMLKESIEFELATKTLVCEENSYYKIVFQSLVRIHSNQICVSLLCLVAPSQEYKMKHHWANNSSRCQGVTS
jgi:hypothetical protein